MKTIRAFSVVITVVLLSFASFAVAGQFAVEDQMSNKLALGGPMDVPGWCHDD